MSKPYILNDVGGNFTINGLPSTVNAATAIQARIVSRDGRLITNWVSLTDLANGNNWTSGVFVAYFAPSDFSIDCAAEGAELHIKATVGGQDEGYKTGNTLTVEAVR